MDSNPPTAGDHAWASAQDAQRQAASNEERIAALEAQMEEVMKAVIVLSKRPRCHCGPLP
jgi:hypothetical protein